MRSRIIIVAALLSPTTYAVLPEPDFLLFGTVSGTPPWLTMGDAVGMTLDVRDQLTQDLLASAVINANGDYVLRVPIDSVDPQAPGTSREGNPLDLFLAGMHLDAPNSPAPLMMPDTGERGTFFELDIDLDGLIAGTNFSVGDVGTVENVAGGVVNVVIALTNEQDGITQQVNYLTVDGTATAAAGDICSAGADFIPTAGIAEFAPGVTSFAVPISLCNDTAPENTETFVLRIANPSNQITLARNEATVTITDDDGVPTLFVNDISVREPESGVESARFRVTLNAAQSSAVTFDYATSDLLAVAGEDYTAANGSTRIDAGQTSAEIAVDVLADNLDETDEDFLLQISNASGAAIGDADGVAVIADAANDGTLLIDNGSGQTTLDGPVDLAMHPTGPWLFVANQLGASVSRFTIDAQTGALGAETQWTAAQLPGVNLSGVSDIEVSADGQWLLATTPDADGINLLRIDDEGSLWPGPLALNAVLDGQAVAFAGLDQVSAAAFSPDGDHVYAVGPVSNSLTTLRFLDTTSQLLMTELERDGVDDALDTGGEVAGLIAPSDVKVSGDGRSVYVAAPGGSAMLHFSRDDDSASSLFGRLTYRQTYSEASLNEPGLDGVNQIALTDDGAFLYATSATTGQVTAFTVGVNGELTLIEAVDTAEAGALVGASALILNGDQSIVLATSSTPGSLHIFSRVGGGSVGPRGVLLSGRDVALGLAGASALAVDAKSAERAYAAAYTDNRVSLFRISVSSHVFGDGFED